MALCASWGGCGGGDKQAVIQIEMGMNIAKGKRAVLISI
jgi:hypothetical protein